MIYTVIFDGGAIATLSNVAHIYDQDKHDVLNDKEPMFIIFTMWGYEDMDNMNRVLDDRGMKYVFNSVNYDAGEFTYSVEITKPEQLQFMKDLLKQKSLDWRIGG